jgi:hypothetical protein
MSVADEGYSNLLTMSVADEGYSNILTMSVADEGYCNILTMSVADEGYSRNLLCVLTYLIIYIFVFLFQFCVVWPDIQFIHVVLADQLLHSFRTDGISWSFCIILLDIL